jgi:CheY-like chemotaxis protein
MNTLIKSRSDPNNAEVWRDVSWLPNGEPERPTGAEQRPRILYVDDEYPLRRLCEVVLVRAGYDVDTAADGMEAWEALQHLQYHLLITDYDMPRLTGLQLATRARNAGMRLPIVLSSGSPEALHSAVGSRLGFAACLPKPFGIQALMKAVEQSLGALGRISVGAGVARADWPLAPYPTPFPHGGLNE